MINRFFEDNKTVFIKFPVHESVSTNLKSCKKLIFYESHGEWKLIGEGNIINVLTMSVNDVYTHFERELFLSKEELTSYVKLRFNKKVLVFQLFNLRKYRQPIKLDHYITMAGEYISEEKYMQKVTNTF